MMKHVLDIRVGDLVVLVKQFTHATASYWNWRPMRTGRYDEEVLLTIVGIVTTKGNFAIKTIEHKNLIFLNIAEKYNCIC